VSNLKPNLLQPKKYSSEAELRKDLAILKDWGVDITRVTTLRPERGKWIIEGIATPQKSRNGLESLSNDGYQGLIKVSDLPASSIIKTERVDF